MAGSSVTVILIGAIILGFILIASMTKPLILKYFSLNIGINTGTGSTNIVVSSNRMLSVGTFVQSDTNVCI